MKVRSGETPKPGRRGDRSPEDSRESGYRLLVRLAGVARGFAFAVFRTVIVPWLGAGVGAASAYFFVEGQISRQG